MGGPGHGRSVSNARHALAEKHAHSYSMSPGATRGIPDSERMDGNWRRGRTSPPPLAGEDARGGHQKQQPWRKARKAPSHLCISEFEVSLLLTWFLLFWRIYVFGVVALEIPIPIELN